MAEVRSPKRRRLDAPSSPKANSGTIDAAWSKIASLQRSITPPVRTTPDVIVDDDDTEDEEGVMAVVEAGGPRGGEELVDDDTTEDEDDDAIPLASSLREHGEYDRFDLFPADQKVYQMNTNNFPENVSSPPATKLIASPIQLTTIRDLPATHNIDTVSLHDILGDPLIKECWQFNYLLSIPFILLHLDADIRHLVTLKIVHGFWKAEDTRRQMLEKQATLHDNVQLIAAHMPEMFGTHHSKMMVLLRHDGYAQVVIHTANMIPQDWANLTQAVWRSPLLPLLSEEKQAEELSSGAIGTGERFKFDLLRYLKAYQGRTRTLVEQLKQYDFSAIRAALIASTPGRKPLSTSQSDKQTSWGWPGLKQILSRIPVSRSQTAPTINIQISSVATLTEKWIQNFLSVLETGGQVQPEFMSLGTKKKTRFNVIFPTPAEIRTSLDGYDSGDSIHLKIQSKAQQKQLVILKTMLCYWSAPDEAGVDKQKALRNRAAPHIKTYVRFRSANCDEIDWAVVSSANLSTQAWGAPADSGNVVRISSYEIGVVVWPELFEEDEDEKVAMVPVFGKDTPTENDMNDVEQGKTVVGFRMPYDLPLTRYGKDDVPWVATMNYEEPDWKGHVYNGYEDKM